MLYSTCPHCTADNPVTHKFCSQCGQAIVAPKAADGQTGEIVQSSAKTGTSPTPPRSVAVGAGDKKKSLQTSIPPTGKRKKPKLMLIAPTSSTITMKRKIVSINLLGQQRQKEIDYYYALCKKAKVYEANRQYKESLATWEFIQKARWVFVRIHVYPYIERLRKLVEIDLLLAKSELLMQQERYAEAKRSQGKLITHYPLSEMPLNMRERWEAIENKLRDSQLQLPPPATGRYKRWILTGLFVCLLAVSIIGIKQLPKSGEKQKQMLPPAEKTPGDTDPASWFRQLQKYYENSIGKPPESATEGTQCPEQLVNVGWPARPNYGNIGTQQAPSEPCLLLSQHTALQDSIRRN